MEISLQYNLDLDPASRWNTLSATAATRNNLLFLQETGDFICGPEYFTTREGFSSYLIKFTVDGCGYLEYQGQRYFVPTGHIFWIDCHKRQHYKTNPATGHWRTIWAHFYGANVQFYYDLFLKQNDGSPVAALPVDSPIYNILSSLLELDRSGTSQQRTDLMVAEQLNRLITACTLSTMSASLPDDIPRAIQSARMFLMQNYREKITLEDLGKQFNMNPFYLQKRFKHFIGQTPTEYLIYLRITHAKELMRTTNKSISEIARSVGIKNLGYFTRLFSAHEGITPHEYCKLWPTITTSSTAE